MVVPGANPSIPSEGVKVSARAEGIELDRSNVGAVEAVGVAIFGVEVLRRESREGRGV